MQSETQTEKVNTREKFGAKWGVWECEVEEVLVGVEKDYGTGVGTLIRDNMDLVLMRADVYVETFGDKKDALRLSMIESALKIARGTSR
jgi:hypothetical protein